jgi:hypothetical protein
MSTLFYSQVNTSVQNELIARGSAGVGDRSTKAMDYMLGKITNVEIQAFDSKPKPGIKIMPTERGYALLGGASVLGNSYMPSGVDGYLNDKIRPSNRIPPIITDVSIAINDQSKSYINKASVSILILDADADLEEMEMIYCKPGRYLRIKYAHPDNAILTDPLLDTVGLPTSDYLLTQFPDVDSSNLLKMNEFYFQGRISTFSFSYNSDGSIALTFEAIGTSNTYADIQVYIKNDKETSETGEKQTNQIGNLYTLLDTEVKNIITAKNKDNITEFEFLSNGTTDQGILNGIPYTIGNTTTPGTERMVSLGYLIQFISSKLMEQVGANITCNDTICKSNLYSKLISADSQKILLWRGKADIMSSTYYFDHSAEVAKSSGLIDKRIMFPNVKPESPGFSDNEDSYPSRIYINLEEIKSIIETIEKQEPKEPTIKNFLIKLSETIRINTGDAINLALVQDPLIPDALLYYDVNYVKSNVNVNEFTLPAFATKTGRSVVREFSLTSNVPNTVKNMIFGIDSWDTGTQKQTAYNPYIYADAETRTRLAEEWKLKYTGTSIDLADKKYEYVQKPANDPQVIADLQSVLKKYVTYFTPNIEASIQTSKAIFPMELEFTIDGINGLKYGDVLGFDGLPRRYTESFVFAIMGITQAVSTDGQWTTQVRCVPRVRIKGNS